MLSRKLSRAAPNSISSKQTAQEHPHEEVVCLGRRDRSYRHGLVRMAEECGTVTVAEMNWASAGAIAQIDKIILENGYGCDVELVTGDTMPTFTSMSSKGKPDMAPELWINAVREPLDKEVAEGP